MATLPLSIADWWQLQSRKSGTNAKVYQYEQLIKVMTEQITRHLMKEGGIHTKSDGKTVYKGGSKYANKVARQFEISQVEPVLSQENYERLVALTTKNQDPQGLVTEYHPLMTLHGTDKPTKVRSIVDHGYLLPGEKHPQAGYTVCVKNGTFYGDGIYTSGQFEVAHWYSFLGKNQQVQLIVNLVLVGRTVETHFTCYHLDKKGQEVAQLLAKIHREYDQMLMGKKPEHRHRIQQLRKEAFERLWRDPRYRDTLQKYFLKPDTPIDRENRDGFYCHRHQAHTALRPELEMVISGSGNLVLPVAVVTLQSRNDWQVSHKYLSLTLGTNQPSHLIDLDASWLPKIKDKDWTPDLIAKAVHFKKICPQYYLVCPPSQFYWHGEKAKDDATKTHVVWRKNHQLLMPLTIKDRTLHKHVEHFLGSLGTSSSERRVMFYQGPRVFSHVLNDHQQYMGFLSQHLNETSVQDAKGHSWSPKKKPIVDSLLPVLIRALEKITDFESDSMWPNRIDRQSRSMRSHSGQSEPNLNWPHSDSFIGTTDEPGKINPFSKASKPFVTVHYMYLLIDAPTADTQEQYEQLVAEWQKLLAVRRVVLKLIFLNSKMNNHLKTFYPLKLGLQTVDFYEDFLQMTWPKAQTCGAQHAGPLEAELERVHQQNANLKLVPQSHWAVPFPEGYVGEGFLSHLARTPEWDARVTTTHHLIYRGEPIRGLRIDHDLYPVRIINQSLDQSPDQSPDHSPNQSSLSIEDWLATGDLLISLVCQARNWLYVQPTRFRYYQKVISSLTEPLMTQLDTLISRTDRKAASKLMFARVKGLYHQLSGLLTEIQTFTGVSFKGQWFQQLTKLRFGRKIAQRVKYEFQLPQIVEQMTSLPDCLPLDRGQHSRPPQHPLTEPADALLYAPVTGMGLRVTRTDASEIEPWLIRVDYVSSEKITDFSQLYQQNELGIKTRNSKGVVITDLLPDWNDSQSAENQRKLAEHEKLIYGWIFTRNPYLYQPAQPLALLTVTWVSALEGVFRRVNLPGQREQESCQRPTEEQLASMLALVRQLTDQIRARFTRQTDWLTLLEKIKTEDDFEEYLTTTHDVSSICLVLGLLTTEPAQKLFVGESVPEQQIKHSRLAFALMAECIMRACRAYLRSGNMNDTAHLQRVLGLHRKTDLDAYQFDLSGASRRTSRFYRLRFTNCSPFALVSTLGFLELYHQGKDDLTLAQAYLTTRQISMKHFLHRHLPGVAGPEAQVALFLQGMKYHAARGRKGLQFQEPAKIIEGILVEEIAKVKAVQAISRHASHRINLRQIHRVEKASPFLGYHHTAKVFNYANVSDLNVSRPTSDRLELLPGGTLKHHCSYPDCPDYLKNFATTKDLADPSKRRRHGIMKHLQHDWVNKNYVPTFHVMGSRFAKTCSSYADYKVAMDQYFLEECGGKRNSIRNRCYRQLRDREKHLQSIWKDLHPSDTK